MLPLISQLWKISIIYIILSDVMGLITLFCFAQVLDRFLASDISEREDLIESYLIGNRLFKFLSVGLPTHPDYFSSDPALVALRTKSQSTLLELLEYIEELELIIDEIEYNQYILQDISRKKSNAVMDETVSTANNTTMSSSLDDVNDGNNGPGIGSVGNSELYKPENKQQIVSRTAANDANIDRKISLDRGFSLQGYTNESSIHKYDSSSRRIPRNQSSGGFEQMVAAVVTANNHGMDIVASNSSSFREQSIPATQPKQLLRMTRIRGSLQEQNGDTLNNEHYASWDALTFDDDFSRFEREQQSVFGEFGSHNVNDLSAQNSLSPVSLRYQHAMEKKPLPKLKKPPHATFPRSVRSKAHANASQPLNVAESGNLAEVASTSAATAKGYPIDTPLRLKIEERLERAALADGTNTSMPRKNDFKYEISQCDDSSLVGEHSERKLLNHFRGCVRCLLD
jgi:hypothetical protein